MRLTIPSDRAARIRLWILVPCRSLNALAPHHITLLGVLRAHGIWYSLRTLPGDSLITRARNNLADIFLRESTSDDDHFALWLDDDIFFDPAAVLQLLALDLDFVTAPYSKKGLHMDRMHAASTLGWRSADLESVAGSANVNFLINSLRLDVPTPVLEAGSGFWLVKRKVLRMMVDELSHPYSMTGPDGFVYWMPPIRYKRTAEENAHYGADYAHDFFKVGVWPETMEYLSEDWWFARQWRRLGGTVHCCFWIKTQHLGPHMYQMDMDAILGLLNQTGGYICGATWPAKDKDKEITNATTQVRTAGTTAPANGHDNGPRYLTDAGADGASIPVLIAPDEAADSRDPGALGQ